MLPRVVCTFFLAQTDLVLQIIGGLFLVGAFSLSVLVSLVMLFGPPAYVQPYKHTVQIYLHKTIGASLAQESIQTTQLNFLR